MSVIELQQTFVTVTCCVKTCGITFAVPKSWRDLRKEDHAWWCCPNGHSQHWPQKSDAEIARESARYWEGRARDHREAAAAEKRRHAATKGQVTKIKNRVSRGVCPCCNRTFQDLSRHMATKHPDYTATP